MTFLIVSRDYSNFGDQTALVGPDRTVGIAIEI